VIVELKKVKITKSIIAQSNEANLDRMLNTDQIIGWVNIQYKNKWCKQILFYDEILKRLFVQYYPNSIEAEPYSNSGTNGWWVRYNYYDRNYYFKANDEQSAKNLQAQLENMVRAAYAKGQIYY